MLISGLPAGVEAYRRLISALLVSRFISRCLRNSRHRRARFHHLYEVADAVMHASPASHDASATPEARRQAVSSARLRRGCLTMPMRRQADYRFDAG